MKDIKPPDEGDKRRFREGNLRETLREGARRLLRAAVEREVDEQLEGLGTQKEDEGGGAEAPAVGISEDLLKDRNLESLGVLAGGLAHDFNNLLMTILGNISLAKSRLKPDEGSFNRLVEAEKACLAGKDLTGRLMAFSRSGRVSKKPLALAALLREWATPFADSDVHVTFLLADGLETVPADEDQIKQAVAQLLTNAREAMPEGGTITVRAGNVTVTGREGLPVAPGSYVRLSIEDTGTGIQKEHIARIFDPYFTTKERGGRRGSGLGLAIVYSVVSRHDGYVTAESVPGAGTALHVYLPSVKVEASKERGKKEGPQRAARILVIDDEDVVRETIAEMLAHIGYDVSCVKTGQEAVSAFTEAREAGTPFAALILDLVMEGSMSGEETLQRLKVIEPGVKAIASSGYSGRATLSEWTQYGFAAAISKPYKIEELRETLARVLKEKGP